MKKILNAILMFSLFFLGGVSLSSRATPPHASDSDAAKERRLQWFREAKFGLFIHWGLYAIPAGEWKGKPIPGIGEWIMNRAQISVREYEKLATQFNPVNFDGDAWVKVAKDAGMKYIVITSKHHDGFALFRSKASRFNVADATPFKRDILKELAAACARQGMRLGFYYSQAQDWNDPNGAGNTWDFGPDDKKDYDKYLREKAEPQVREILTHYGPVALVWFDTPRMMTPERSQHFVDIVRSIQPDCLIDGRLGLTGKEGDYRSTGDNAIPDQGSDDAWETPATINHTWGYKKDDHDWKRPGEIIFKLLDIVSKGGNYLLNVGPMADGVIPARSVENLREVGKWLQSNGEAVYGAGRTPFGEELGGYLADIKDRTGQRVWGNRSDWRCTTKPGKLYFTVFTWPRSSFDLPRFNNKVKAAYLLIDPEKRRIPMTTGAGGIITLQTTRPERTPIANVIVVEIEGDRIDR
ncbi:MAG TPA: alpha-L-fucosidase [Acidobacteriota bacterium]|jgi:alpha-L-fucosidase|nr:alpha-L-fucosidase [Acidobacteriota bacterium]